MFVNKYLADLKCAYLKKWKVMRNLRDLLYEGKCIETFHICISVRTLFGELLQCCYAGFKQINASCKNHLINESAYIQYKDSNSCKFLSMIKCRAVR